MVLKYGTIYRLILENALSINLELNTKKTISQLSSETYLYRTLLMNYSYLSTLKFF